MAVFWLRFLSVFFCICSISGEKTAVVSSDGSSCSKLDAQGVSTFTIRAQAPQLNSTSETDLILIQFDSVRKLPISSTIFMDELNQLRDVSRDATEPFGPFPCSELPVGPGQQNCSTGFSMTPEQKEKVKPRYTWDRGHLTPVNPMRFSMDAIYKTFFCVNIAPQDSYTNQNPWRDVEVGVQNKLKAYADGAYVQTGVCSEDNEVDGPVTYRGFRIPKCFWKLVCYKNHEGKTQVVGFIGDNTLVRFGDKPAELERDRSTVTPRSQAEILSLVTRPTLIATAWKTASTKLLKNRSFVKSKVPTATECSEATALSPETEKEWSDWMNNRKLTKQSSLD